MNLHPYRMLGCGLSNLYTFYYTFEIAHCLYLCCHDKLVYKALRKFPQLNLFYKPHFVKAFHIFCIFVCRRTSRI
nr:MAG TPA: hypothetical protein [Caudoviricetes sp.]